MRSLKDWYVQIEKVNSSPTEYLAYLLDKRRHKGQKITPIKDALERTERLENDRLWFHSQMKRGGHIPSPAYSLMISFPFELSNEQWGKFNKLILEDFYSLVLDDKDNSHLTEEEKKSIKKSVTEKFVGVIHKGNHQHFMLPKIFRNPKIVLDLSKKRFMVNLKQMVDKHISSVSGHSKSAYIVADTQKKLSRSSAKLEKHENDIKDKISTDFVAMLDDLDNMIKVLKENKILVLAQSVEKKKETIKKYLLNQKTQKAENAYEKVVDKVKKETNLIPSIKPII